MILRLLLRKSETEKHMNYLKEILCIWEQHQRQQRQRTGRKQPFSDELAKPRAFAFKNSYMTYVLNNYIIPEKIHMNQSSRVL